MPQFDLTNASLSSGLSKIKTAEKYIPFVYDGYPYSSRWITVLDNDPKPPSATTNYISDFYGRVPLAKLSRTNKRNLNYWLWYNFR